MIRTGENENVYPGSNRRQSAKRATFHGTNQRRRPPNRRRERGKTSTHRKGDPALPGEKEAVAKHVEGYIQAYAPVGVPERTLVINIARNHWRQQRAHDMEDALFNKIMLGQSDDALDPVSLLADAWLDPKQGLKAVALSCHPHSARHRKEHRRVERAASPAKIRVLQSRSGSNLTHAARPCQRPNGGRRERLPTSRTVRWLCLFTARNRSRHRSHGPPGGGQGPLLVGRVGRASGRSS